MTDYANELSLGDALARYFDDNGFGPDGGYPAKWVLFKLGPLPLPFPNTDARRRAVRYHDLHHILTGYATDFLGEFEISAWEIGSGCRDFFAAWHLNLGGLFGGVVFAPRRTFKAFVRGRHTDNFYGRDYAPLLGLSVGQARALAGTASDAPGANTTDFIWFGLAALAGAAVGVTTFAVVLPLGVAAAPFLNVAARRALARAA